MFRRVKTHCVRSNSIYLIPSSFYIYDCKRQSWFIVFAIFMQLA